MSKLPSYASIIFVVCTSGFTTNQDEFLSKLPEEHNFCPYGELFHVYRKDDALYEVYKVTLISN